MKEIIGSIQAVRAVEDCIRATKHYSEGLLTKRKQHPIQGEKFASKVFCKYYEVYPEMEVPTWNDKVGKVINWLDTPVISIQFYYDYRANTAKITTSARELLQLRRTVPNFREAIKPIIIHKNYGEKFYAKDRGKQVSKVRI